MSGLMHRIAVHCSFLAGLRFANLDSKALQAVFEILQQHFPECLSELWFLNAPFIFWGLWKIVSPFINPATKEKIVFVNKSQQASRLHSSISEEVICSDLVCYMAEQPSCKNLKYPNPSSSKPWRNGGHRQQSID